MFHPDATLDRLNAMIKGTMCEWLGIEFTEIGTEHITAKMPVDHRTIQPLKMLHGGASVALAETLGSMAASISVDPDKQFCVGLEINANHIKAVREGFVSGTTRPLHIGRSTQVWEIKIVNEKNELVNVSRITMAVMDKR